MRKNWMGNYRSKQRIVPPVSSLGKTMAPKTTILHDEMR